MAWRLGCDVSKCEVSLLSCCENWKRQRQQNKSLSFFYSGGPFFFFYETYIVVIYLFSGSRGTAPIVH